MLQAFLQIMALRARFSFFELCVQKQNFAKNHDFFRKKQNRNFFKIFDLKIKKNNFVTVFSKHLLECFYTISEHRSASCRLFRGWAWPFLTFPGITYFENHENHENSHFFQNFITISCHENKSNRLAAHKNR